MSAPMPLHARRHLSSVLDRAIALHREVEIHFASVAYWNASVRQPHEMPIEPDPDGALAQTRDRMAYLITELTQRLEAA